MPHLLVPADCATTPPISPPSASPRSGETSRLAVSDAGRIRPPAVYRPFPLLNSQTPRLPAAKAIPVPMSSSAKSPTKRPFRRVPFYPFTILSITHNPAITIKPSTRIRLPVLLKNPAFAQNGPIALERIVSTTPARERTCIDIEHFTVRRGGRKCIPGGQIQLAFSYAHFLHFSIR